MSDTPDNNEEKDPFLGAEMIDRAARKAEKEKKKKETAKPKVEKDELDEAIERSHYATQQKARNKKLAKRGAIGLLVALFGWWFMGLFEPYKAGPTFGICRVFLENSVRYPTEMHLSTVEQFEGSIRIWYAQTDAFGDYRLENIQCFFESDPNMGARVAKITINRRAVDQARIDDFNRALPVVLKNLPDLTYPKPLPNSLRDLQIDANRFRRQLF